MELMPPGTCFLQLVLQSGRKARRKWGSTGDCENCAARSWSSFDGAGTSVTLGLSGSRVLSLSPLRACLLSPLLFALRPSVEAASPPNFILAAAQCLLRNSTKCDPLVVEMLAFQLAFRVCTGLPVTHFFPLPLSHVYSFFYLRTLHLPRHRKEKKFHQGDQRKHYMKNSC